MNIYYDGKPCKDESPRKKMRKEEEVEARLKEEKIPSFLVEED